MGIAVERLRNRTNLKESLDRITTGNANRQAIISLFNSHVIVDNSKTLDLTEARTFAYDIRGYLFNKYTLLLFDKTLKDSSSSSVIWLGIISSSVILAPCKNLDLA